MSQSWQSLSEFWFCGFGSFLPAFLCNVALFCLSLQIIHSQNFAVNEGENNTKTPSSQIESYSHKERKENKSFDYVTLCLLIVMQSLGTQDSSLRNNAWVLGNFLEYWNTLRD